MAAVSTNDINALFLGEDHVTAIYLGTTLAWAPLDADILFVPDEFEEE